MMGIRDIPHDHKMPHLRDALDSTIMAATFQSTLFDVKTGHAACEVDHCEIMYVKYKPGRPCAVCYCLKILDTATGRVTAQRYSALIAERGSSEGRYKKADSLLRVRPPYGKSLIHVPDLGMVAWSFPNDGKLRDLPLLTDPGTLQTELFPKWLTQLYRLQGDTARIDVEVMNYVPRYSCTVKVDIRTRTSAPTHITLSTLYGKMYSEAERATHAYQIMLALWESHARTRGEFRMAQPAWHDAAHKIVWQFAAPGTTLLTHDTKSDRFLENLTAVGRSLAALHSVPVNGSHPRQRSDLLNRLRHHAFSSSLLPPDIVRLLDRIIAQLLEQGRHVADGPPVTIHGDLHLKNVIASGPTVIMIDLDDVQSGPPLHDIGSFLSFLFYHGIETGVAPLHVNTWISRFIHGYHARASQTFLERDVRWHAVAALIDERVVRCLTKAKPGTVAQVERIVQLAHRLITASQTLPVPPTDVDRHHGVATPTWHSRNGEP